MPKPDIHTILSQLHLISNHSILHFQFASRSKNKIILENIMSDLHSQLI